MRQTGDKMWGKGGGEEGEAKRNERNKGAGGNSRGRSPFAKWVESLMLLM